MNRTRMITVVGTLTLVILAVGAWLLVLSPRVGKAAEIQAQSDSVATQTAGLESQIIQLEGTKDELPAKIARFEKLKANFPRTADVPALLDQLRSAAARTGVSVMSLETSAPVLVVPGDASDPAAGTDGGTTSPTPATSPTPPATGAVPGASAEASSGVGVPAGAADGTLATMPMSVTVSGSYDELTRFFTRAENLPRAWLIDNVSAQAGDEGSRNITLTASGSMFVLDTTGIALPDDAAGADE